MEPCDTTTSSEPASPSSSSNETSDASFELHFRKELAFAEAITQSIDDDDDEGPMSDKEELLGPVESVDLEQEKTPKRRGRKRMAYGSVKNASSSAAKKVDTYCVGELCFAQVRGFTFWPSRVEEILENTTKNPELQKYKLFFFGTHDFGFCKPADMKAYNKENENFFKAKYNRKGFHVALKELNTDPAIVPKVAEIEDESSNDDSQDSGQFPKKLLAKRRRGLSKNSLPRSYFGNRSFFFGDMYDAGVLLEDKLSKPPPLVKEPTVLSEAFDDADFDDTLQKLTKAFSNLRKSSAVSVKSLGTILGLTPLPLVMVEDVDKMKSYKFPPYPKYLQDSDQSENKPAFEEKCIMDEKDIDELSLVAKEMEEEMRTQSSAKFTAQALPKLKRKFGWEQD